MNHVLRCSGYGLVKTDIDHAEGCSLYDLQGNCYLDFESGTWCAALGYAHPRINQVIHEQIDRVMHIGYRYSLDILEDAARLILDVVGIEDGKCVLLSSGSEAVEFAVQTARRVTRKPMLLTMADSFLGSYGSAGTKHPDEWCLFDWGDCADCAHNEDCFSSCEKFSQIPFESLAALVFEPGSSSGLVRFPPKGPIQALAKRVRAWSGLLVANEVTTGMGRTGLWFGHQHYALNPDLVALGKCLGNGYPVSAVAMTNDVADRLMDGEFHYAQSHQNDPLAAAVAHEVISVMREERIVERGQRVGQTFLEGLHQLADHFHFIREARGRGMMAVLQFTNGEDTPSVTTVCYELLERGFIVGSKPAFNLLRFFPPLITPEEDVMSLLEELRQIFLAQSTRN